MVVLSVGMPGLIATDLSVAFAVIASAFLGVALLLGFFGPLTNSRALEELSPSGAD
jgi:hypothetical protein